MMVKVKKGQKIFGSTLVSVILVFIIIIAINVISAAFYFRLDMTEEKLYTLSAGTRKIVKNIETPVNIKYYFTRSLSTLPLNYKNFGIKVEELLQEYRNINSEMVTLEVFDPKPDSDEEEWAQKYGLNGLNLGSGERLFMGLVVIAEDQEKNLPFFDPRREKFLEYDITQLILQMRQKKDKNIGLMSSLPVMGQTVNRMQQMQGQQSSPKWVFMQELEKTFNIQTVEPSVNDIDEKISILLLIHPKELSERTLYAIDQFVLRGGELVVLVDPNARVDQAAAIMAQMGQMAQANSDLPKLFKHWGIEYKANSILGDKDHATTVNAGDAVGTIPFALWHSLDKSSFNQDLIATKELENMLLVEPGGFLLKSDSPLKLNSLIKSSTNSGMVDNFVIRYSNPAAINKQLVTEGKAYTISGILTGELTSAFTKRPESPKNETQDKSAEKDKTNKLEKLKPHISKSVKKAKILLITDVDFIADRFSVEQFNLLGQVFSQPKNDNLNFIVNMVEFLGGAEEMMEIRSRGKFSRSFTRFDRLETIAQARYQAEEAKLSGKLKEVQDKLSRLNVQKGTNKIVLTKEQIDKIKQFRDQEKNTKTELRKIRKLFRQDIETEKISLTILNLTVVPILLVIFGLLLYFRRFKPRSS